MSSCIMSAMNSDSSNGRSDKRILLLTTARSYRGQAFLAAAARLGIAVVQGIDTPEALCIRDEEGLPIDFAQPQTAVAAIQAQDTQTPFSAILATDDSGSILAALASAAIGLPHNSVRAAHAARDKGEMREQLAQTSLNTPAFQRVLSTADAQQVAAAVGLPCVVKPLNLNGSRGVIRANNLDELRQAIQRTSSLVRGGGNLPATEPVSLLVESYIPGIEVALEGLLEDGRLQVLALFDKPDPLEGPFFEETLYITPSRLDNATQTAVAQVAQEAAQALGLVTGPLHAELRLNEAGPWIIEVAGRSIGGLCSRTLQFGIDTSLEEVILRQACGLPLDDLQSGNGARGVMMIPIPRSGLLRHVEGMEQALAQPLITAVEITAPLNNPITRLPEGDGYLGFIFARGDTADAVEAALRAAHKDLIFQIDPLLPLTLA